MSSTLLSQSIRSVALPTEFFGAFRSAANHSPEAINAARDAGYAAGAALYETFGEWLDSKGEAAADRLNEDRFGVLLGEFLKLAGWGNLQIQPLSDAVMALDTADWAEADPTEEQAVPSCHFGTGLLAGFLGRLADAPLAVLEVECRSAGGAHCRFAVGSVDVLQYMHEAMERGVAYEHAAESASTG